MTQHLFLTLTTLFCLACSSVSGKRTPALSEPFAPVEPGSVFASYEPLNIELEAPLKDLFDKVKKTAFPENKELTVEGKLAYTDAGNQRIEIPVVINVKGFSSLFSCDFPKLELKMKGKERAGTLFATTKSIDLNTHCFEEGVRGKGDMMAVSFYNHREFLIYRMAEVLSIPTYKARPVFVHYKNTQIPSVDGKEYRAFFVEDMGSFRKRLNAKEIKGVNDHLKSVELAKDPSKESQYAFSDVKASPMVDAEDAARIALFQNMVSNKDWHIKMNPHHERFAGEKSNLWNTKIVELPNGRWVLFPQDFSLSGIMSGASFAPLDKVAFGFSPQATQDRIKQTFIDKKPEIYALLNTLTKDPKGPELMKTTLDHFYKNLEAQP